VNRVRIIFLLSILLNCQAAELPLTPPVSFIQPIIDTTFLSYSQRINRVKLYIDANLGQPALDTLKPLMRGTRQYQVMLLAAQSYAELERPIDALNYFELAHQLASSGKEVEIADVGINKMQSWINGTIRSWLSPIQNVYSAYYEHIKLIKAYVNENKGSEALKRIKPILMHVVSYDIYLLAAQAYAESEEPKLALHYYELAHSLAKSPIEIKLALTGISKMHLWLESDIKKRIVAQHLVEEDACKGGVIPGVSVSACVQRIRLARQYLSANKGLRALGALRPLLTTQAKFDVRILAAQAYAEINEPRMALAYYKSAFHLARKVEERTIALFGIGKMQFWLGNYYPAMSSYRQILDNPLGLHNFELAKAGLIKSLAYADRPILGYRSIPEGLVFTTPEMVVAASQATLWGDQADLSKYILERYQSITQTIDPNSNLGSDLQDLQWQVALSTNPNVLSPSEFYSEDSEHFTVLRSTLDYSHYWSQQHQSFVGFEQNRYKQLSHLLNAEGVYFQEKWRPTRTLILNGKVQPTTYQLWNPFLWTLNSNYRPNDHFRAQALLQEEVIETFPAFDHHITDLQSAGNVFLSPLPYFKINGSLSRLNISDSNVRNGYYIATTAVLSTVLGLNLTLQKRAYTDKFVSRYYFSPNQYSASTAILRIGSKTRSVWHYYIDAGIGTQNIGITGNPTATSPTHQFGFGFNGPISQYLILNAYYALSHQATAFINTPNYTYQYGGVSLNILL
jgi:tetratricopeptide (TPR) repeat protein